MDSSHGSTNSRSYSRSTAMNPIWANKWGSWAFIGTKLVIIWLCPYPVIEGPINFWNFFSGFQFWDSKIGRCRRLCRRVSRPRRDLNKRYDDLTNMMIIGVSDLYNHRLTNIYNFTKGVLFMSHYVQCGFEIPRWITVGIIYCIWFHRLFSSFDLNLPFAVILPICNVWNYNILLTLLCFSISISQTRCFVN